MMKAILLCIMFLPTIASAQELASEPAPAPIAFSLDERRVILQMCEVARWASRIQFDNVCEGLKAKFVEADKTKLEKDK